MFRQSTNQSVTSLDDSKQSDEFQANPSPDPYLKVCFSRGRLTTLTGTNYTDYTDYTDNTDYTNYTVNDNYTDYTNYIDYDYSDYNTLTTPTTLTECSSWVVGRGSWVWLG